MKKNLLLVAALLFLAGCAHEPYLARDRAFTKPKDGISIPRPAEMKKIGVKGFSAFVALMNPDLLTEVVAGSGVWPLIGFSADGKEKVGGYCFLAGMTLDGDFYKQCVIARPKAELEKFKFFIFNRDANWAYRLDGDEAGEVLSKEDAEAGKKPLVYDAEKFDKDAEYQEEFIRKFGMSLDMKSVQEIMIGSPEWEKYCEEVEKLYPQKYKMKDGQIRLGVLPLDDFRMEAVSDPGFDGSSRFIDRLSLPIYLAPFAPWSYPLAAGAGMANTAIAAGVDRSWKGYFARAQILRYQMAPTFHFVIDQYKALIRYYRLKADENKIRPLEVNADLRR